MIELDRASLDRALPPGAATSDWDDVLNRVRAHRHGRRQRLAALAGALLIVAVATASAFGTVRHFFFGEHRSAPAWAGRPIWSPDGRRIAFVTVVCTRDAIPGCTNQAVELNSMTADGSGQRNLTREWRLDGAALPLWSGAVATWSRDWRRIAFVKQRGGPRHSDVYVINADGSGLRRLTRSPQNDGDPIWSPDGRRLAFVRVRGRRADIYIVNADGSGLRSLAHAVSFTPAAGGPPGGFGANPEWSPDGRKIAFMSDRDGHNDIFVVNADGSGLRNLTRGRADTRKHVSYSLNGPAWSPDGRMIAFGGRRDRPSAPERAVCRFRCFREEIYVLNADGSGLRRLTHNWFTDGGPVWSPDGRKILFEHRSDISVMNADGSGQRNLARSVTYPYAMDEAPAWSPDGRRILFVSNRSGTSEVYVMNADGSGERKLTHLKGRD